MSSSTNHSDFSELTSVMRDTLDSDQHQDTTMDTTALPKDYPVLHLTEARAFYHEELPPFVRKSTRKMLNLTRTVVLAAASGNYPLNPIRVDIIVRSWDDRHCFWTLDLNKVRYIVSAKTGGCTGAFYCIWAGPEASPQEKPIAFAETRRPRAKVALNDNIPDEGSSDSSDSDETGTEGTEDEEERARLRPSFSDHYPSIGDGLPATEQEVHEPTSALVQRLFDRTTKRLNSESTVQSTEDVALSNIKSISEKRKQPTRHSDLPARLSEDADSRTALATVPTKRRKTDIPLRELQNLSQTATFSPLKEAAKAKTKNPVRTRPIGVACDRCNVKHFKCERSSVGEACGKCIADKESCQTGRPLSNIVILNTEGSPAAQLPGPNMGQRKSKKEHHGNAVTTRPTQPTLSPAETLNTLPNQILNDPGVPQDCSKRTPILSVEELQRTTVLVRVQPDMEYQICKLTDCPNVATLYGRALNLWELDESAVTKMRISFNWMEPEDDRKKMLLNKEQEDSFIYMLEQVEDYPSWEDRKARCKLNLDIFLK